MSQPFSGPPPDVPYVLVTSPKPHILLVTINRPRQLNAVTQQMHVDLEKLWNWYDEEPSLRCAVLTGSGRAFCAGADLKEWNGNQQQEKKTGEERASAMQGGGGFAGMSNRRGKKPIIAAVNGLCFGGGLEVVINCDMAIASDGASFGLPEVKRGVVAIAGALPRLMRTVGRKRASEMALLGRSYTAKEALDWGLINRVVAPAEVVSEALWWASELANNSPDSVIVSREGLLGGWDPEDPVASTLRIDQGIWRAIENGDNMKEGVLSFVEKRNPTWKNSKL